MADRSNRLGRGLATKSVASIVAFAFATASVGTTSLAFAQAKPAPVAKPVPAPKPAAKPVAKPAGKAAEKPAGPSAADKKKAGAHFKKGKELFDKKDYKGAKDELKSAEDLIPAGTAEYYLGRCAEELGDSADAAAWYDKSIASGKLKDDLSSDAKARLAAIKSKPIKVKVTSDPPGAIIMIDGKDSGQKTPAELDIAPGKHQVTLALTGKKASDQEVDVVAGAAINAKLEDAPVTVAEDPFAKKDTTVTPPPPPPTNTVTITPDTKKDNTWVIVTGIGAVVGLGVGTVFGLKALSDKKSFDDNPTTDGRDKGTRDALIADMGFGIGITLAVTSAVLYFSGGSSGEPKAAEKKSSPISDFSFAPVVGGLKGSTGMAGASAAFHF